MLYSIFECVENNLTSLNLFLYIYYHFPKKIKKEVNHMGISCDDLVL